MFPSSTCHSPSPPPALSLPPSLPLALSLSLSLPLPLPLPLSPSLSRSLARIRTSLSSRLYRPAGICPGALASHPISDAHKCINEIPTAPLHHPANPQPRQRARNNPRGALTSAGVCLSASRASISSGVRYVEATAQKAQAKACAANRTVKSKRRIWRQAESRGQGRRGAIRQPVSSAGTGGGGAGRKGVSREAAGQIECTVLHTSGWHRP
jgi:hypothetical protein